jgi:hypothetical protein
MRYYINNHPNRLKNNYRFNSQIETISNFGFDNFTIDLVKKIKGWTVEYSLVAIKDGAKDGHGTVLTRRGTYKQILEVFLNIDKRQFKRMLGKSLYC